MTNKKKLKVCQKAWKASIKMLKKEGYKEPIEYRICLDKKHYLVINLILLQH